jgi:hypothetical protein
MWFGWAWFPCAGIVASFVGCTAAAQRAPAPSSDLAGVWICNFTLGCVPPLASTHCLGFRGVPGGSNARPRVAKTDPEFNDPRPGVNQMHYRNGKA